MRRDIFQAIADPTRRAIIALIALQAMTPNAIAEQFDITRQAVSKHLRILTECEIVTQEQKGREIYYSLEIEKMKEIDSWLEKFRQIWNTKYNQLDELSNCLKFILYSVQHYFNHRQFHHSFLCICMIFKIFR